MVQWLGWDVCGAAPQRTCSNQCLEAFWVSQLGRGMTSWVEARDAAKHPAIHRTAL